MSDGKSRSPPPGKAVRDSATGRFFRSIELGRGHTWNRELSLSPRLFSATLVLHPPKRSASSQGRSRFLARASSGFRVRVFRRPPFGRKGLTLVGPSCHPAG